MSARRPGIMLDSGRTGINKTDPLREVGSYPPELLPDCPSLEVRLQNIQQEDGESDEVGVDKTDHSDG